MRFGLGVGLVLIVFVDFGFGCLIWFCGFCWCVVGVCGLGFVLVDWLCVLCGGWVDDLVVFGLLCLMWFVCFVLGVLFGGVLGWFILVC